MIYGILKELQNSTKDLPNLTKIINTEFKKKFSETVIKKIKEEELGKASDDAKNLVEFLRKDSEENKFFSK